MSQKKQTSSVPPAGDRDEQKDATLPAGFSRVMIEHAYDYNGLLRYICDEIAQQIGDLCIIGIFSEQKDELQVASVSHRFPIALKKMRSVLKKSTYPIQHVGFAGLMLHKETYIGNHPAYEQIC